jgi:hypothetical protein
MESTEKPKRLSIDELEKLLQRDDEQAIQILPNGEIVSADGEKQPKVLTLRENLGGEYARPTAN